MASVDCSKLDGDHFESALRVVCFFELESFCPEQFFEGKNVFFSAATGYGQSDVFQPKPNLT